MKFDEFLKQVNDWRRSCGTPQAMAEMARIMWSFALMDLHHEDEEAAKKEFDQIFLDTMDSVHQSDLELDIIRARAAFNYKNQGEVNVSYRSCGCPGDTNYSACDALNPSDKQIQKAM